MTTYRWPHFVARYIGHTGGLLGMRHRSRQSWQQPWSNWSKASIADDSRRVKYAQSDGDKQRTGTFLRLDRRWMYQWLVCCCQATGELPSNH